MIAVGAGGCFQNATYGNARVATGVWLRTMAGAGVPSEGWTSADPPGPRRSARRRRRLLAGHGAGRL